MTSRTPLLPVDQQMRADAELGAAWRRCEAALPNNWFLHSVATWAGDWRAIAESVGGTGRYLDGFGPTPAAALDALTEALANR